MLQPDPQPDAGQPGNPGPRRPQTTVRRIGMLAYRLVRPVVRPLAWRLRRFLTIEITAELADARFRQEVALQRLDSLVQQPHGHASATGPDPRLAEAMERLLLTLALEDSTRPDPPGLTHPT